MNDRSETQYLPLSWSLSGEPRKHELPLPKSRFLFNTDLVSPEVLGDILSAEINRERSPVLIRGVLPDLAEKLVDTIGGSLLALGICGRIDLPGYRPSPDVLALARRAARYCTVELCCNTSQTTTIARALYHQSRYANQEMLRYLFRTPQYSCELSVIARARFANQAAVAVLTLSRFGARRWHIEQMIRSVESPFSGVMELLFVELISHLQRESQKELNLGEVPFHFHRIPAADRVPLKHRGIIAASRVCERLFGKSYSASGLFSFKQKFAPRWEPLYWYSSGAFHLRDFSKLYQATGCQALMLRRRLP